MEEDDRVLEKLNRATHLDKLCSSWDMLAELDTKHLQNWLYRRVTRKVAPENRGLPENARLILGARCKQ